MYKFIGMLAGSFFLIVSFINFIVLKDFFNILIYSSFLLGICFTLTTLPFKIMPLVQVILTLIYGCFTLYTNDSNSLVPLIMLYLAVTMTNKYYPKEKYITLLYPLPFLATALFTGWSFREIILTIVLYTAYTTTQCIFNHT